MTDYMPNLFDLGPLDALAAAHALRADADTSLAAAKEVSPQVRGVQKAVLAHAAD